MPLILEHFRPRSVVDVGCGTGDWLAVFREHGADDVLGIDGPWVDQDLLAVSPDEYRVHDLREPVQLDRMFDLALSLEVVGHISPMYEPGFLDSLVALAPVILFSAPIPHQGAVGGVRANNRWPAYWAQRLADRGFVSVDCLRTRVWEDVRVAWWYAQNIWLAVRADKFEQMPRWREFRAAGPAMPLPLVHPTMLDELSRRPSFLKSKVRGVISRGPSWLTVTDKRGGSERKV